MSEKENGAAKQKDKLFRFPKYKEHAWLAFYRLLIIVIFIFATWPTIIKSNSEEMRPAFWVVISVFAAFAIFQVIIIFTAFLKIDTLKILKIKIFKRGKRRKKYQHWDSMQ